MSITEEVLPEEEIKKMIAHLQMLNAVRLDQIASWETGYPNYHPDVRTFFGQIKGFWNDYDYVKNMEVLTLDNVGGYDLPQIKTILTMVNRQERFGDGLWEQAIRSGLFVKVEKRLRQILAAI